MPVWSQWRHDLCLFFFFFKISVGRKREREENLSWVMYASMGFHDGRWEWDQVSVNHVCFPHVFTKRKNHFDGGRGGKERVICPTSYVFSITALL